MKKIRKAEKPQMDKELYRQIKSLLKEKGMSGSFISRVYYFYTRILSLSKSNFQEEKKLLCYVLSEEKDFHPFLISQLLFESPNLRKQIEENKIEIGDVLLEINMPSLIHCFDDNIFFQLKSLLKEAVASKMK